MTPTEQDKLIWLVRVHTNLHYRCEYRQDGLERASVKCGGCYHSSESIKRAEQNIIDFVSSITADRKCVELEARIEELETKRLQVQRIKQNIVEWSNSHEALGIGYIISHADSVDHITKDRIAELKAKQEEV